MVNDTPLYPYSVDEAKRNNELERWRSSHKANIACKKAIEEAIRRDFDGMHLKADCAKSVISEYGFKRVNFVLANTLRELHWDGRFSQSNKEWSKSSYIPPDKEHNADFTVASHPAVLDGFINQARRAYHELGLFEHTQCEPDSKTLNYEGKVLVLSPDILKESCWRPEDQLWFTENGFGCDPDSSGRAVFCMCLSDGERTRWNRHDFVGILKDEHIPEWAREKLQQLASLQQEQTGAASMDGMNMT